MLYIIDKSITKPYKSDQFTYGKVQMNGLSIIKYLILFYFILTLIINGKSYISHSSAPDVN
jgi:hypothetical protein